MLARKRREGVEQQEAEVLEQDKQGQGDAGVVDGQFCRPGVLAAFSVDVGKRQGEQQQGHGCHGAPVVGAGAMQGQAAGQGQDCEAERGGGERRAVQLSDIHPLFAGVGGHGGQAQQVTAGSQGAQPALQQKIEQQGGQQAESGGGENQQDLRLEGQQGERAGVPDQRQRGGGESAAARAEFLTFAVAREQDQEDAEDESAGGVSEQVGQQRLVDAHVRCLTPGRRRAADGRRCRPRRARPVRARRQSSRVTVHRGGAAWRRGAAANSRGESGMLPPRRRMTPRPAAGGAARASRYRGVRGL